MSQEMGEVEIKVDQLVREIFSKHGHKLPVGEAVNDEGNEDEGPILTKD